MINLLYISYVLEFRHLWDSPFVFIIRIYTVFPNPDVIDSWCSVSGAVVCYRADGTRISLSYKTLKIYLDHPFRNATGVGTMDEGFIGSCDFSSFFAFLFRLIPTPIKHTNSDKTITVKECYPWSRDFKHLQKQRCIIIKKG